MKKAGWRLLLLLASLMMMGWIVSGCNSQEGQSGSNQTGNASTQPAATDANGQGDGEQLPPVKLIWYVRSSEPANAASVVAKANEIIQEKLNATVDFRFVNPGDYEKKMQLIMSASEEYDIAFTAAWSNSYLNNVSKGAYIALDDLLENRPELKGIFKDGIWDAVRVNGKIYGIPNNQIMAGQSGLWFKKDLLDKYQLDVSHVKTAADLTPIFQTIKDNEPGVSPIREGIINLFNSYVPLVEGYAVDTQTWKVYDPRTTDYIADYQISREWYQKGFFPQDVATLKDETSLIKAGKIFSRYTTYKPGIEADIQTSNGWEAVVIASNAPVIKRATVQSTMNAISVTSKNPERALQLLELVNTDKELYNLLIRGIEGQDYKKLSDNRIEPVDQAYSVPNWIIGNVFNGYLVPGQQDDVWEKTIQLNEAAALDPLITFDFDRTPVENEIAQISAIRQEIEPVLKNGLDDVDAMIKRYNEKMKAAGTDKVMAEIESQLAAWRAKQP